jgi:hypothetical protein
VSVAAKKSIILAVETEPVVGLRSGLRWAQKFPTAADGHGRVTRCLRLRLPDSTSFRVNRPEPVWNVFHNPFRGAFVGAKGISQQLS